MDIRLTTQAVKDVTCDALVVGAVRPKREEGESNVVLAESARSVDAALGGLITEACAGKEFRGKLGEALTIYTMGKLLAKRVVVIGLGNEDTPGTQAVRRASAIAVRSLQKTGARRIALALNWTNSETDTAYSIQAQVEGALLGSYTFKKYKSRDTDARAALEDIQVVVGDNQSALFQQSLERGQIMAEATNFARDLINEPPNTLTPTELANRASAMAQQYGITCEILERPQMEELGMGGLLGVAQGSAEPPKFIILRYTGAPQSADKGVALVGKGITFDTGGISLKPPDRMDEMKGDMGGAAAVIGAIQAIARLKPAINVTTLVSTTENMPSGTAYRPGDILRIMNGKTIEIVNTDAEGRLVLADALSYAVRDGLSPIIDVATLTGGIVVALGSITAGVFTNDEQLGADIVSAGRAAGEKFWVMPMDSEYAEQISSEVADIKQTGGRGASSITAAKILENFVGNTKWAHLDIAGTSYVDSDRSSQEKGGTGMAVRTLAEFVLRNVQ